MGRVSLPSIVKRRGCDLNPLGLGDENAVQRLRYFIWPDRLDRSAILDSALALAAPVGVEIDRAEAADWVILQLERRAEGVAAVVFHSALWQYLSAGSRQRMASTLEQAGERTDDATPLAYLRFEPEAGIRGFELRLTCWPGGSALLLATADPHGRSVRLVDVPGLGGRE